MKRKLAIALVIVLVFSSTAAFATTGAVTSTSNDVHNFINGYSEAGFEVLSITEEKNVTEVNMQYEMTDGELLDASVTIIEKLNGDMEFICREEGLTDVVLVKSNGDIFINNELVRVEERIVSQAQNVAVIEPMAQRYNKILTDCPYGEEEDYTYDIRTVQKNVVFERELQEMTLTAVITGLLKAIIPLGIGTIAGAGLKAAIAYYTSEDPYHQAVACEYTQYVHGTKGEVINGEHIFMFDVTYYKDNACTQKIPNGRDIFYNVIKTG